MARCPKLDYESNSYFGNSGDKYICKVTYGEEYQNCPVYKNS